MTQLTGNLSSALDVAKNAAGNLFTLTAQPSEEFMKYMGVFLNDICNQPGVRNVDEQILGGSPSSKYEVAHVDITFENDETQPMTIKFPRDGGEPKIIQYSLNKEG